jgi:hypothetical protein
MLITNETYAVAIYAKKINKTMFQRFIRRATSFLYQNEKDILKLYLTICSSWWSKNVCINCQENSAGSYISIRVFVMTINIL